MIVIHSSSSMHEISSQWKKEGYQLSYVPTMGYLHDGHLELMRHARKDGHKLIVSIFVNPAQFNDPQDLEKYPIDIEGDKDKCKSMGVDCLFLPSSDDIYPDGIPNVSIQIPHLMNVLCGKSRPGHFEGVLLVLSKLFHIIEPNVLYMGKKDYQQFKIVSYFIESLGFAIKIYGIDTVREQDGLAMSSRNARLSDKEREAASLIHRMLSIAARVYEEGERDIRTFKEILTDVLASNSLLRLDYLEIVDIGSLKELDSLEHPFLIAVAVYCGKIRLIDNREYY